MRNLRIILSFILLPASFIYGFFVAIRNKLYDFGVFSSHSFRIPVIAVGNITVGGTGKTPHTEFLANLLKKEFNVAILSRGYKRKTRGFRIAGIDSSVAGVGDEPLQMKLKYPGITVAVESNRVSGIKKLLSGENAPDVVLLDDAFQHRRVNPNLNILLIDYSHPINKDFLLPLGNLREPKSGKKRANIIVVTKSPSDFKPIQRRVMLKKLKPYPYQKVFFTTLEYGEPIPVFPEKKKNSKTGQFSEELLKQEPSVLLVTAIANPTPLKKYLEENISEKIYSVKFADHHRFSTQDISRIQRKFEKMEGEKKVIITTEKDAVRLRDYPILKDSFNEILFYIPVKIKFLNNRTDDFNKEIIDYVRKNKKHSFLYPQ
ncbi:MAG: tetraacyldisaccharide 4'-kinase [Bacteroidota bacterium]